MRRIHNPLKESISIPLSTVRLSADLSIPSGATGLVIFVHGSGSSRFSPRNRYVADLLNDSGLATLLFDLLTPREEEIDNLNMRLRFDIGLLSSRVAQATQWIQTYAATKDLSIGYFGASTGAAAALMAAAQFPTAVGAVVSRGGRPDLAGAALYHVYAPTLLIVGEDDRQVLALNQEAAKLLQCTKHISIVPKATHLFEEPGALEQVGKHAAAWFTRYLAEKRQSA
jgi:pimeloyl-ACP methyl ester carboxylesterase